MLFDVTSAVQMQLFFNATGVKPLVAMSAPPQLAFRVGWIVNAAPATTFMANTTIALEYRLE